MSWQYKGEAQIRWSWLPYLGFALEMGSRPVELLKESGNMFGEIFGLIVAGNRMFFINDPHSASIILKPTKDLSFEEFHHSILVNFFGANQNTVSSHLLNEDLMRKWYSQYLLSDVSLHAMTLRMQSQLVKSTDQLSKKGYKVDLFDFLSRIIFQASVATLFNEEAGNDVELYSAFLQFDKQLPIAAAGVSLAYFSGAAAARATLLSAVKRHTTANSDFIAKRWEHFADINLPPGDAAAYQLAILWASVGNTMPITFWLLFHLLNDPQLLKLGMEEIHRTFAAGSRDHLSQDQLNGMVFLDACITEALRLSSGSLLMRYVRCNCTLTLSSGNTYNFRQGDQVGLCPALNHLDEEVFPNPTVFAPARWLQGATEEEKTAGSCGRMPLFKGGKEIANGAGFLPFGGGLTLCPGRRFARNEVKTLVAFLLSRTDMKLILEPGCASAPVPAFDSSRAGIGIFPPKGSVWVQVTPLS